MQEKIGISGTHSVGKTTLMYELYEKYVAEKPYAIVKTLKEPTRNCPFPINSQSTMQSQSWIWHAQMLSEIEKHKADVLICDRTVLDTLAYSRALGFESIVQAHLMEAIQWLYTYDIIFFLRPDGRPIEKDGQRSNNEVLRAQVDSILKHWFDKYKIKVCRYV